MYLHKHKQIRERKQIRNPKTNRLVYVDTPTGRDIMKQYGGGSNIGNPTNVKKLPHLKTNAAAWSALNQQFINENAKIDREYANLKALFTQAMESRNIERQRDIKKAIDSLDKKAKLLEKEWAALDKFIV